MSENPFDLPLHEIDVTSFGPCVVCSKPANGHMTFGESMCLACLRLFPKKWIKDVKTFNAFKRVPCSTCFGKGMGKELASNGRWRPQECYDCDGRGAYIRRKHPLEWLAEQIQ